MEKTVLCIRNRDMRQEYLAELMRESGYEVCLQEKIEGQKIETWDIILLPVVTGEVPFENISGHIRAGQHVFAGTFPRTFQTVCREKRASCHAYMSEEEIAIKNAVAAAEGAIAEAILNGKENLQGGSSLVLGYGRCGSVLADKLRGMGSTVTVYEKDPVRKTQAEVRGFSTVKELKNMENYKYLFQTIPQKILDGKTLAQLRKNAVIIDIASGGGVDYGYCREHGICAKLCPGLPGKYAPLSSARILAEYIVQKSK